MIMPLTCCFALSLGRIVAGGLMCAPCVIGSPATVPATVGTVGNGREECSQHRPDKVNFPSALRWDRDAEEILLTTMSGYPGLPCEH